MKNSYLKKMTYAICLALFVAISAFGFSAFAASVKITIDNPYENVNWTSYGQYKANLHAHSTNSDGANLTEEMVEDFYAKGLDILAMTDHDYLTDTWDRVNKGPMSTDRLAEIEAGIGRSGRGILNINNTNEQSVTDHINTFWAPFNNVPGDTMETILAKCESLGGISHINHMGRYTGGANSSDDVSRAASNNPVNIKKYVDLLMAYPSCVGMEIINKIDNESKSDRILWDNVLMEILPQRNCWGFSNDDSHSLDASGYSWNVMLMPDLTQANTRIAMEKGAFYAVSRVSRLDGINRFLSSSGGETPGNGTAATLYMLEQPTPRITNIDVNDAKNTITITGANYTRIEWIADGQVIATGNTLNINDNQDKIGSYVRAQLKSSTGIAFSQPFVVSIENEDDDKNCKEKLIEKIEDLAGCSAGFGYLLLVMLVIPFVFKKNSVNS